MPTANRLAKNSIYMYIRMIFLMIISFYTSRVVLQKLGVDDYGIYNLVGSVVAMFSSLRTIFSASTQRFINYEMGRNNNDKLCRIFNNSIIVNFIICSIFLVIVEAVGLWFLSYMINVDASRLFAAHCVFQFSVLSAIVGIMTTTFDAEIIAHEKMNFYAYLSITEGTLKLLIVFLLSYSFFDKLILYGLLVLIVHLVITLANIIYCRYRFSECRIKLKVDWPLLKEMTIFAGWNFWGANAFVLSQSGLNMLLNIFGGPIVNAARGVAYQVNGALNQFINNVVVVVTPYCTKTYASGDKRKTFITIYLSSKIFYIIQLMLMIPLLFFTKNVLSLWLVDVPEHSVVFLQLILLYSLFRTLHPGLDILFKAHGDIKLYQICEGLLLLLPLLVTYYALNYGCPYYSAFIILIIFDVINLFVICFICSKKIGLPIKEYMISVILPCFVLFIILILSWLYTYDMAFITKIYCSVLLEILSVGFMYMIGLSANEKRVLTKVLNNKKKEKR